jgi:tRNA threonylcarbamoyladenosine biosynthesis protein TsaB
MIVLAVDTSTSSCSVALLEDGGLLAEVTYTSGKTHSRHLMTLVQSLLIRCDKAPEDIEGIAVTKGPGTFTGLRIGLSTVKGLAAGIQVPVVGIGSLAALAYPLRCCERQIVPMIDARRGEVYHATYQVGASLSSADAQIAASAPDAILERLSRNSVLVGTGALCYRKLFEAVGLQLADPVHHIIRASSVGLLAMERFRQKDVDVNETLIPDYIRKSDAQLQSVENV